MEVLIVYDSQFGNTERIARIVADTATDQRATARLLRIAEADAPELVACDLLIVAAPTQRQKTSPAMRAWLESLPRGSLKEKPAATFDTRYRMSRLLTGSAAERIASRLKRTGASLLVPPESFFIARDVPPQGQKRRHELERLEQGEEEHASTWAAGLLERLRVPRPAG
jgi:flavodoxin